MGHLIGMVTSLVQSGVRDETLPESARGLLDEDTQRRWSEFVGGALTETNRRNETNLVGIIHDSMYKYMYVALELMLTPLPRYLMPIAFLHTDTYTFR